MTFIKYHVLRFSLLLLAPALLSFFATLWTDRSWHLWVQHCRLKFAHTTISQLMGIGSRFSCGVSQGWTSTSDYREANCGSDDNTHDISERRIEEEQIREKRIDGLKKRREDHIRELQGLTTNDRIPIKHAVQLYRDQHWARSDGWGRLGSTDTYIRKHLPSVIDIRKENGRYTCSKKCLDKADLVLLEENYNLILSHEDRTENMQKTQCPI